MNNSSLNHFAGNPVNLDIGRSKFKRPFRHITSFDAGKLIPIYWDEILPGDTVSMDLGSLVRMSTPLFPVMDNAFLDVHAYFVPNRLLWEHWEEFCGANKSTYWTQPVTYVPPMSKLAPLTGYVYDGSITDYLGLPVKNNFPSAGFEVSALPFRAYVEIWNDWYRDQNTMQPANVDLSSPTPVTLGIASSSETYDAYIANGTYVTRAQYGDKPLPVCKFHDMFTSLLPYPQKGGDVGIGLAEACPIEDGFTKMGNDWAKSHKFQMTSASSDSYTSKALWPLAVSHLSTPGDFAANNKVAATNSASSSVTHDTYFSLVADLASASSVTVNALREAFAVQRFLEKQARGGTRYTEILNAHFGVTSSDASLQRPQFLGGKRIPINITQVAQTSAGSGALGDLAAFSQTVDGDHLFSKSFEEHGILMIVACVRTERSYQQGVARKWTRTELTDYYFPTFANLGEMPCKKSEIYLSSNASTNDQVLGYREAWAEYRFSPNLVTGSMRSTGSAGYDSWHYADYYTAAPSLTASFIREPQENVARTLAVANEPQFLAEFAFDATWVRPMPVYSIPGLIDHH